MSDDSEYIEDGKLCLATINFPEIPDSSVRVQVGTIHCHLRR